MSDSTITDRHTRALQLLANLEGFEGTKAAKDRESAWNYYLQRPRGDEVEGRSPVVTGDVSAMVESTLSQVVEALATDELAEFEGTDEADEFQAKQEGVIVSASVMTGKGWYRLASAVKSALLLRLGVMTCEVVNDERRVVKRLAGVNALARALLKIRGVKIVDFDPAAKTCDVEVIETEQRLETRCVDPENFLHMQWPLDDFENIPACAERFVTTRQALIDKHGRAQLVDNAPKVRPEKSDETVHRPQRYTTFPRQVSPRQELVEWFRLYYLHDGVRYCAVCLVNAILSEEEVSTRPPYALGVPFINPGNLDGFSIYDKLRVTQDITTALTRMLNDNSNAVTMNRLAVIEGAANNDQLTDQDPTGILQIKKSYAMGDIRNAVMPIGTLDLTAGLVTSLNYQRSVRSEMAGASLDVGTGQVQLPDRMGSMGLDRAYSASEQLSSLILKTISQTLIKDLWLLAHEQLRNSWVGPVTLKTDGRWLTANPSEWKRRSEVFVKPGMSPGERQRRSQALGAMIQLTMQLAEKGMEGVLVDAERFYRAVCDWARVNDISRPEQYLIDPTSDGAKAALASKAQQAKAQQEQAAKLQQMALGLEQMDKALQKYGIDVKAAVEKYKTDAQTDTKEAELTTNLVNSREERELKSKLPAPEPVKNAAGDE